MKEITTTKTAIQRTSKKSDVIIKSRDLNEAHFPNFGLNEYRLFSLILSKAIRVDKNNPKEFFKAFYETHIITPKEFSEIFDVHISHCYRILRECGETLYQNDIIIKDSKTGTLTKTRILDKKIYNEENHSLEIGLSLRMIEHLDITKSYVKSILYQIAKLRSVYSIRLYELIISFKDLGKCRLSIERLRFQLGVDPTKLKEYNHFKDRALIPAINEVNKIFNFGITYTEIKTGRKITAIELKFKKSKKKERNENTLEDTTQLTYQEDIITRLIKAGVQMTVHIRTDILHYTSDRILEEAYKRLEEQIKKGGVRNSTAYFIQLVKKLKRTGYKFN